MKTIKFRAWDIDSKKMLDVKAIDWDDKGNIISINYPEGKLYPDEDYGDHVVLMQFTGMCDKNGKEIYEGDILDTGKYEKKYGIVKWNEKDASFRITNVSSTTIGKANKFYEIVGNIYENQDLLGEKR